MFNTAAFLTYAFVTAITPGPNNIMSMGNASRLGLRRSFPFNLGVFVGFMVVGTLCTLFSSLLFSLLPRIRIGMQVLGALYMLYLAYKTFTAKNDLESTTAQTGFFAAALLQFINPKVYISTITSMSTYILPHFSGFWPLACFIVLLSLMAFVSTLLWALFGSVFRRLLSRHGRVINTVMALLLVYCAVSLFF